ncbi:NAD-dependent epimerase/dehydratase family protein [uncultured Aeromicrobium sp.]|uniref:NAD-dependent epimerase/dehydratase family protein n=1 Tax=uncultured Aeromicrobium sp. TaxID=337820 RepID=UPI0025D90379|nr:NAD-dependent epimerase/dehydratase family protein [uncultured Aeromicrobium sp.]
MKIVVVGASGNIGSAVVRELSSRSHELVAVARRLPQLSPQAAERSSVTWKSADIATSDLEPLLRGADAVIHLAWLFQPTHDPDLTWRTNAVGTQRVLDAVARADVPAVVVASSVAAYSPRAGGIVDESWPTDGPSSAAYAREKAYVERLLDIFELRQPGTRVVRIRPAFVFQRSAATAQRRLFGGPLLPGRLLDPRVMAVVPVPKGFQAQAVHSADLARAFAAAAERDVRGPFNIAADDVLDRDALAEVFSAKALDVPAGLARRALTTLWNVHLAPVPGDLFDAFMRIPVMSSERAREDLDWQPHHTGRESLQAFLDGVRQGAGSTMPPLDPQTSGPMRAEEFRTGVGSRPSRRLPGEGE